MAKHRHEAVGSRHPGVSWDYDNAAERTGASGFDTYDLGGFAWQKDNDSIWVLTAVTPTWVAVGGGTSDPNAIHDNVDGEINAVTSKGTVVAGDVFLIEDSAASFAKKKVSPGAISHTLLGDIGSNNHAAIDTHLGNTSNPHSVTKSQVGLGTVPNLDTTDAVNNEHAHSNKAQLDLVTDGDHDIRTDNPHSVTKLQVGLGSVPNLDTTDAVSNEHIHSNKAQLDLVTDGDHDVRTDNPHAVSAAQVGAAPSSHVSDTGNPHSVTKTQVGLSLVPNVDCTDASNITSGQLPNSVLPPLAITEPHVVVSEAAQLALTVQEGDVAIRTDINKSFIHNGGSTGTMTDWYELLTPTDTVLSVNGQTGTVVLDKTDVGLGSVPNLDTTDAVNNEHTHSNKVQLDLVTDGDHDVRTDNPHSVSPAQIGAAPSSHVSDTGNPHSVTKSQVGLGTVPNLDTTNAVSNEHTHSNKAQLDLVTDGDHDVRTDNPHGVSAAQVGAIDGPGSSTNNAIMRFDGTDGHQAQNSGVTIDDSDNVEDIRTATFKTTPTVTPSGGTLTCEFDEYQKIVGSLNNNASLNIQLNVPNGPGNYMLLLIQGSSTPTTSITWVTEGTHALYAPGGAIEVQQGVNQRTLLGLFYDGSAWYVTSSAMAQVLAS